VWVIKKKKKNTNWFRGVRGEPQIFAKRNPSVSNTPWESIFQMIVHCHLNACNCFFRSSNLWRDTVFEWTHWILKEGNNLESNLHCACWGCYSRLSKGGSELMKKAPLMERLPRRFDIVEHQWSQLLHAQSNIPARGVWAIRPGPSFLDFLVQPPTPRSASFWWPEQLRK